jgi:N-sulfoglucosamine sulfohydrolase
MPIDRYSQKDVHVPGFLPDLPDVREEIATYLNSTYRCDLFVGKIIQALKENGLEDNTLVVFLSDNGMHFPFAKSNCYLTSVKTPLIFYWKGQISAGMTCDSLISTVDLMPTILDMVGCSTPHVMDGRSFVDLLQDPSKKIRDFAFASINAKGKQEFQMRSLIGERYGYIYNHFADGKQMFYDGKYPGGASLKAMVAAAKHDAELQKRVDFMYYRTKEEFYDYRQDASALTNLIDSPSHTSEVNHMRREMRNVLKMNGDPYAEAFVKMIEN